MATGGAIENPHFGNKASYPIDIAGMIENPQVGENLGEELKSAFCDDFLVQNGTK